MPGLVGTVSINGNRVNSNLITAMRDAIRHRAWYKVEDYQNTKKTVAISLVDLGVLKREKQPYVGRSGKVKIFLHGEINNDEVVNANPLEFIYSLYEKKPLNFASALNGSFIVIIIDEDEGAVLIANDRLASKSLFYFNDGQAVYFSPEMKSIFLVASLERKINFAAVADFLARGHFTRDHTFIEDLRRMDKATVLKITNSGITSYQYWEWDLEEEGKDLGLEYYQKTLIDLTRQAVHRCFRTINTYGVLLSGGYDSRGILGCYLEENKNRDLHTISWGREEDIPDSDCAIAKKLAQKLNAIHSFYKLSAEEVIDNFRDFVLLGEGLTWYPESFEVFHRIKEQQRVDIILRGDECFGFSKELEVHDEDTMFRVLGLNALQSKKTYQRILKPPYYTLFCEYDAENINLFSSRCKAKNIHNRLDFFYLDVRLKYFLNPLNYVKNFALESFRPLLDSDILEFVRTLPVKYRLDKNLWRKTVVETFPELYEEFARIRNDINWADSFKASLELKHFVYRTLVEEKNIFSEFIDTENLENELDAFFAIPLQPSVVVRARKGVLETLKNSPNIYRQVHKYSHYFGKWIGKTKDPLPTERLFIRLLILKVWGDVFLNYPVVNNSRY